MRRLRILLIEDDALMSTALSELLTRFGHEVCGTAATEGEAVAAAVRYAPDLMITDANLRSGTGMSAMAAILRLTAMPHIFITGGSRLTTPASAITLLKPFGPEDLRMALERAASQIV